MKILFLGTGAADWPEENGGRFREFRRKSSVLVDGELLIDPGPGVPGAMQEFGVPAESVKYVIVTHSHSDHCDPKTVEYLLSAGAELIEPKAGQTCRAGKYEISAFRANHGTCAGALHFLISDGSKNLFYGLDGAWLLYDEVQAIIKAGADLAVLDATVGEAEGDYRIFEHNNLRMVREIKLSLAPYVKRFCISHMAMTLHGDHKTLSAGMAAWGIETAYDGMETEI